MTLRRSRGAAARQAGERRIGSGDCPLQFQPAHSGQVQIQYQASRRIGLFEYQVFRCGGEDLNTMEAIQQVLRSGALTHMQLSQQELSLQHHFRVLDEMMALD